MGLFSKRQSDEEYARLKAIAINDYNRLIIQNPFASAEDLRDKWMNMYQQIKQVYKLSKKYSDTESDVPIMRSYRDDALNRSNEYAHEIEYLVYKEEFDNVCNRYKELEENKGNAMNLFGDSFKCYQIFESLYKRADNLNENYKKFQNDNIDENKLQEVYKGTAYYYTAFMLAMLFYQFDDGRVFNWNDKKECIEKCKRIAGKFDEGRFKVIVGNAEFEMGELWKEYAESAPQQSQNDYYNKIMTCRRSSVYSLKVLEDKLFCMRCSVFDALEWHYFKMGFWNLYSTYVYTNRDYGNAYSLTNTIIESQKINSAFSNDAVKFVEEVKEEQKHFKQGMFGSWKYVK